MGRRRSSRDGQDNPGPLEQPGEPGLQCARAQLPGDFFQDLERLPVLPQGSPGQERDAMLLAIIDQVVPLTVGKTIAILYRDYGDNFAPALHVFLGYVREADVANLTLLAKLGERFHRSIVGDGRIRNMQLVDID